MNKTTEALKLAEEAANRVIETLEYLKTIGIHSDSLAPAIRAEKKALAAIREALAQPVKQEPVAYVTEPQNVLPNGLTLLQTNPDYAVQLNAGRDFGWLYVKGADGQWVTDRKLSPEEINEAQDQAADMVVLKMESVLEKMFAAPITTPPTAAIAARQMRDSVFAALLAAETPYTQMTMAQRKAFGDAIAALPVPEFEWRDLTDDEIDEAYEQAGKELRRWQSSVHGQTVTPADFLENTFARAVVAAFKEKNR